MNKSDFEELALIRLKDAEILLENNQYDGAYYLSGYAIECALKACIAGKTREFDFPPNARTVQRIYTHDLSTLLGEAGLKEKVEEHEAIEINWAVIKDWSEQHRYEKHTEIQAKELYSAVADPEEGVLQWIKQHW